MGNFPAAHTFNGLVCGSFYALLALGLAVIFGMLRVVNFAHGAIYMLGAFGAYVLLAEAGINVLVGAGRWCRWCSACSAWSLERTLIRRLSALDPLYNFLLTFGLTLILQDAGEVPVRLAVQALRAAAGLGGELDLGLFGFPAYRVFVFGVAVRSASACGGC